VAAAWHWLGERSDVNALLASHHALVHASFYEGLPNVVCEALAAGRPVLVSAVCDHPRLVEPGVRGFLFDPNRPADLLAAIESLHALPAPGWLAMGEAARRYAEVELGTLTMVARYEALIHTLRGPGDGA
jgi:glycosyltransferase involved in cell wall biosynthesis